MLKWLGLSLNYNKNRIYGLDILRAFAIFIVVITHAETYAPAGVDNGIEAIYLDAVTMFFVLSGFLIGGILIKTIHNQTPGYNTLANFWWRRWMRTLPIYFLVLSLVLICYHHTPNFSGPTYKRFYVFSQNLVTAQPGFFIEAWSLSVEEWFYLLIPLLAFIFIKYFRLSVYRSIFVLSVLVIAFSTSVRLIRFFEYLPIDGTKFEFLFRMQVITRLDSLMYGVLGALMFFFNPVKWSAKKELKFIIGVAVLIINKVTSNYVQNEALSFYHAVFYLSFNAIGTLLMLPILSNYKSGKGVVYKVVTYLSLISYSMYLINLTPIQYYVIPFLNHHYIKNIVSPGAIVTTDLLLYFPITFFGSVFLYKFIETPFMNLRDKITHALPEKKAMKKVADKVF